MMMAIALLGALALGVMSMSSFIAGETRSLNATTGARTLLTVFQGFLTQPGLCFVGLDSATKTFDGAAAITAEGMPIFFNMGAATNTLKDGGALDNYDVMVDAIRFRTPSPLTSIGNDPSIPGNVLYSGTLSMKLSKLGGVSMPGGRAMKERVVSTLLISVNPTTLAIGGCYGTLNAQQDCVNIGGAYDPTAAVKCKIPYPCEATPNSIFLGYDPVTNIPKCKTVAQIVGDACPAGQYLVSDGSGGSTCQSP
jgi:hypothetical protein